jgi:hypothetical protein
MNSDFMKASYQCWDVLFLTKFICSNTVERLKKLCRHSNGGYGLVNVAILWVIPVLQLKINLGMVFLREMHIYLC